jgi:hypothetical protein
MIQGIVIACGIFFCDYGCIENSEIFQQLSLHCLIGIAVDAAE